MGVSIMCIIIVLFNLLWMMDGFKEYINKFRWSENRWLSVGTILYNLMLLGFIINIILL